MLESGAVRRTRRSRYWTVVKQDLLRTDVLTVDIDGDEEAVAVFGFEEEAEMFLKLEAPGMGWRTRETTTGELLSVLFGPCAGVGRVVLDPLPRKICCSGSGIHPLSMGRKDFAQTLMDTRGPSTGRRGVRTGAKPTSTLLRA